MHPQFNFEVCPKIRENKNINEIYQKNSKLPQIWATRLKNKNNLPFPECRLRKEASFPECEAGGSRGREEKIPLQAPSRPKSRAEP
jgi:hypothetical protein